MVVVYVFVEFLESIVSVVLVFGFVFKVDGVFIFFGVVEGGVGDVVNYVFFFFIEGFEVDLVFVYFYFYGVFVVFENYLIFFVCIGSQGNIVDFYVVWVVEYRIDVVKCFFVVFLVVDFVKINGFFWVSVQYLVDKINLVGVQFSCQFVGIFGIYLLVDYVFVFGFGYWVLLVIILVLLNVNICDIVNFVIVDEVGYLEVKGVIVVLVFNKENFVISFYFFYELVCFRCLVGYGFFVVDMFVCLCSCYSYFIMYRQGCGNQYSVYIWVVQQFVVIGISFSFLISIFYGVVQLEGQDIIVGYCFELWYVVQQLDNFFVFCFGINNFELYGFVFGECVGGYVQGV